jgi:succinate dehydrogenase hydrophobic anchor subunit
VETFLRYLFVGAVIAVLFTWWWHFHTWSNSPRARRARSPLWLGFSASAAAMMFLIAGMIGFNLSKRARFFDGTAWADGVIWWQVASGLALLPVAIYLLRRGVRELDVRTK